MSALPISGTTTGSSSGPIVLRNWDAGPTGLTLTSPNGVATSISADGSGGITFGAAGHKNHTFSKPLLEEKIKEFHAGKYTRKYIDTYLDFMVMEAMLDNLEYLEYKASLNKEQL